MTLGSQLGLESDILTREIEEQGHRLGLDTLVQIYHKILQIKAPDATDAAYLFTNTSDNQASVFEGAQKLYQRGIVDLFLIMDGPDDTGYPGAKEWLSHLQKYIPKKNIKLVEFKNSENLNTYSESQNVVMYARKNKIDALHIVAAPFHMLRAFMTIASEAIKENAGLRVYPWYGSELDWERSVLHSQGRETATRRQFVRKEMQKIRSYQIKPGNIMPTWEITNYVQTRL